MTTAKQTFTWLHRRFILRQLTSARQQSILLVLCVALSMVTLVALRGFGESVNRTLQRDARQLSAADIVAESSFPFSQPLLDATTALQTEGRAETARVYEFLSVVRGGANGANGQETLLSNLKVVDPAYPFYGVVELASGQPFSTTLQPGSVLVEQYLLDRLKLNIGDTLNVGSAALKIAGVVIREPDRPVSFNALGPRVFIHSADLAKLDLVKTGSRVDYKLLFKVNDPTQLNQIADRLKAALDPRLERVGTFETRQTGASFFLNNLVRFLSLVGIFTLLLAGIGIQTALTAFLRERNTTIAIVKTLGADSRFVTRNFLGVVALLGVIGTLLGISLGFALQYGFPILLKGLLPPDVELRISPLALFESLLLGAVVVGAFTYLPIYQLEELKPSFIFRKEAARITRGWPFYVTLSFIILFFLGMVLWQLNNLRNGLYFVGGVIGLLLLSALLTWVALWITQRVRLKRLEFRQAQRGLFRPRNASFAIIVTFAAALAVIFCVYLIESDLRANFVQTYPADAPNVFFIDIQPNQLADFDKLLSVKTEYYPIVRGTIESVNGEAVKAPAEDEPRGETLARPFNLTYRDQLIKGETLSEGRSLFGTSNGNAVSVLDEIFDLYRFKVGDQIRFKIQGIPIDATVTSIRSRDQGQSVQPFFSFVFPTTVLQDAPQSIFTAVHLPPAEIHPLQNKVVTAFPNISVIDATETIRNLTGIIEQVVGVLRFFSLFSVLAGVLIVISSVFATRHARVQEAAYYKVLGATSRFVLRVFALENLLMGLISALLALLMAQIGTWLIAKYLLEVSHEPNILASLGLVIGTMALVTIVGLGASLSILRSRPITYLRQNSGEE
ncbi:MAG: FtsX-like permease family protein [Caldilineaceae bacterium]